MLSSLQFILFFSALISAELQCPPAYTQFSNTKCFYFSSSIVHFTDAQKNCTWSGGTLASISNAFENTFATNLAFKQGGNISPFIGLTQTLPDKLFHWIDGTTVGYTSWNVGEPNFNNFYAQLDGNGNWHTTANANQLTAPFLCSAVPQNYMAPTSIIPARQCDSGWTYFSKTGYCYKTFFNEGWFQAEQVCRSSFSHLTSIHSLEENGFVASISQSGVPQPIEDQVWIGITKVGNTWTNVDGTPVDYFNWGSGILDSGNDNCIQLFSDPYQGGIIGLETTWNSWDCELNQRAFVCKKSPN